VGARTSSDGARPTISIGILCYQQAGLIGDTIRSALAQTRPADEIVVVDDASGDGSAAVARRFAGVRILEHPRNRGRSAVRNTLLAEVTGDILVFLDGDTRATPTVVAALAGGYTGPEVVGVGGRGVEVSVSSPSDRWRERHATQSWGDRPRPDVPFLFGLSCSFRTAPLRAAGGFRGHGEDQDIARRLRQAGGCRLAYTPDAVVLHARADDYASLAHMMFRWWRGGYITRYRYDRWPAASALWRLTRDVGQHVWTDAVRRPDPALVALEFALLVPRLQGLFRGAQIVRAQRRAGQGRTDADQLLLPS
jgi:glycosyltransferase involved in cell wall biosynthesis